MITITPYRPEWAQEYQALEQRLSAHLGATNAAPLLALRIDHIGSTAVPGLAAKDIIDIQVTVASLSLELEAALNRAGFERKKNLVHDHLPPGAPDDPALWSKWVFKPLPGERPVNLHVRIQGMPNQRYPILFRDYLRTYPDIAEAYARVKIALAQHHPEDSMEAYYDIKDPVCDIIYSGAELWAAATGWVI